jgi:hypothetical protein
LHPRRINPINRVIPDVCIEVGLVLIPNRVNLQKPAERGGVDAGLVVPHAEFGQPDLAGVAEPVLASAEVGAVGLAVGVDRALRQAVFVVGIDLVQRAVGEHCGDDRALVIGDQLALAGPGRGVAFEPEQRVICPGIGAVDVAAQDRIRVAVFERQRVAIVEVAGGDSGGDGSIFLKKLL